MNTVAILAGGKATRLYPLTLEKPKSLIPIQGRAFIDFQLELLLQSGINRVILCLGHLQNHLVDYINQGQPSFLKDLDIQFSLEEQPLGTGGAILHAIDLLGDDFGVLYGDSYLPIEYEKVFEEFRKSDKKAVMTVYRNDDRFDKSNVEFDGHQVVQYSKNNQTLDMKFIDYGFLIFRREVFTEGGFPIQFDLSLVVEGLASKGQILGFEVLNRFYEVGSFQGIQDLEAYLGGKEN